MGKNRVPDTYYINNDYTKGAKVYEDYVEFRTGKNRKKCKKIKKTNFLKEYVESTDFYKPVLNKVMTTEEKCIKYNFMAPLITI